MSIYKAHPTLKDKPVPDLQLIATEQFPTITGECCLEESRRLHEEQGALILDALLASLPGGTIDALLVALLDHKRSLFRVRHEDAGGPA